MPAQGISRMRVGLTSIYRMIGVLKAEYSTGDIKLTVSSPGLADAVLNIKTFSEEN